MTFQSTPSTRRVTPAKTPNEPLTQISIHTLHTEGDTATGILAVLHNISIHTLHTEGDSSPTDKSIKNAISIHTLHTEGDSWVGTSVHAHSKISIHTLHTEGDGLEQKITVNNIDFNPHPPHGG